MNEKMKIFNLKDMPDCPEHVIRYLIPDEAWSHLAETRQLTMADLERAERAYEISEQNDSCCRCVYAGASPFCGYPFSDGMMRDYGIEPCYDGVLRYLAEK